MTFDQFEAGEFYLTYVGLLGQAYKCNIGYVTSAYPHWRDKAQKFRTEQAARDKITMCENVSKHYHYSVEESQGVFYIKMKKK